MLPFITICCNFAYFLFLQFHMHCLNFVLYLTLYLIHNPWFYMFYIFLKFFLYSITLISNTLSKILLWIFFIVFYLYKLTNHFFVFIQFVISIFFLFYFPFWDYPFSTYARFHKELTFLAHWYAYISVRIRG